MKHRDGVALVVAVALVSGCFQAETPRHDAAAVDSARIAGAQGGAERAIEAPEDDAASVPELAWKLREEPDPDVRREVIYAIADAGDWDDAAIIGQSLTDPDIGVREAAIEALTGIGGEGSADWLSLGLGDPDPGIRRTAVEALGEIGGNSARSLLQQALEDVDPGVREAARQMLDEPAYARNELR